MSIVILRRFVHTHKISGTVLCVGPEWQGTKMASNEIASGAKLPTETPGPKLLVQSVTTETSCSCHKAFLLRLSLFNQFKPMFKFWGGSVKKIYIYVYMFS